MQPAAFEYHRPETLAEALELLAEHEDARPLAGGQSLLPAMKLRMSRPAALVDLGRVSGLGGIEADGDGLRIGATTRYVEVLDSDAVRSRCPVLAECVGLIGDAQVRNVGTLGGSVAHMDPAADLPTLLTALDAAIEVRGADGERAVPAREFFVGMFTTALRPGELVTALRVPATPAGVGAAYRKHRHPASRYAVVGVAAVVSSGDAGDVEGATLAVGGATGVPTLVELDPGSVAGRGGEEVAAAAADAVPGRLESPMGDGYASGEYRVHLASVLARRAVLDAAARAEG